MFHNSCRTVPLGLSIMATPDFFQHFDWTLQSSGYWIHSELTVHLKNSTRSINSLYIPADNANKAVTQKTIISKALPNTKKSKNCTVSCKNTYIETLYIVKNPLCLRLGGAAYIAAKRFKRSQTVKMMTKQICATTRREHLRKRRPFSCQRQKKSI